MPRLLIQAPEEREERSFPLGAKEVTIGRASSCELQLVARSVSLRHAKIIVDAAEVLLIDLGATNGTTLNGQLLPSQSRAPLRDGDLLQIGTYRLSFAERDQEEDEEAHAKRLARLTLSRDETRPSLSVLNGPQAGLRAFVEEGQELALGRGEDCQLSLVDGGASRRHALLRGFLGGYEIEDLGSLHGTLVDQVRLHEGESAPLKDRSEIQIGQTRLSFCDPEDALFSSLTAPTTRSKVIEVPPEEEVELEARTQKNPALPAPRRPSSFSPLELTLLSLVALCLFVAVGFLVAAFGV